MSNDIINSGIKDLSDDILCQVIDVIKNSQFGFSLQLDESTDVSNRSQLISFVRYIHLDRIKEEFLFCKSLIQTTRAIDVFNLIRSFSLLIDLKSGI